VRGIVEDSALWHLSAVRDAIGYRQRERCSGRRGQSTVQLQGYENGRGDNDPLYMIANNAESIKNQCVHFTSPKASKSPLPSDPASPELLCLYV
jgi:hypothetical protein